MTKPDFSFDEQKIIDSSEFSKSCHEDDFIEGARYQHSIDLAKHEEIVGEIKKELDTVIKIGVEGQREINRKLSVENKKLKANLEKAINSLKHIRDSDSGPPFDYCVELLQEDAREVLKEIEGEK